MNSLDHLENFATNFDLKKPQILLRTFFSTLEVASPFSPFHLPFHYLRKLSLLYVHRWVLALTFFSAFSLLHDLTHHWVLEHLVSASLFSNTLLGSFYLPVGTSPLIILFQSWAHVERLSHSWVCVNNVHFFITFEHLLFFNTPAGNLPLLILPSSCTWQTCSLPYFYFTPGH